jgi:hypothetical protein
MRVSVELKKANGQTQIVQVPAFLTSSSVAMKLLKHGQMGASPSISDAKPKQTRITQNRAKLKSSRI